MIQIISVTVMTLYYLLLQKLMFNDSQSISLQILHEETLDSVVVGCWTHKIVYTFSIKRTKDHDTLSKLVNSIR